MMKSLARGTSAWWTNSSLLTMFSMIPAFRGRLRGTEDFKQRWVSIFRTAFPDLQLSVKDQVAEEDKVVTCYTGHSTHQGELMGIPPAGNEVSVDGIITSRSPAAGSRKSGTTSTLWA
jgi:hypothetical protein